MSFHWNLSSEDELEGDEEEKDDSSIPASPTTRQNDFTQPHTKITDAVAAIVTKSAEAFSDDDDIDWEDADNDDDHEEENSKLSDRPLRPVTITIEQDKERSQIGRKGRKRNRKVYRNATLSSDLRDLLNDIHKTHLLALTSRAVLLSKTCSNSNVFHLVQSLMPLQFESDTNLPSLKQVKNICLWYFDFVNRVEQRRRIKIESNAAAGASMRGRRWSKGCGSKSLQSSHAAPPITTLGHGDITPLTMMQLCAYLSSINDENPQLTIDAIPITTNIDKVQLLVALFRSLGWRARYVMVLDPVHRDLDVNHPLLVMSAAVNVFQNFLQKSKRAKLDELNTETSIGEETPALCETLAWVEVICQGAKKAKWTHIDTDQEWIDDARLVETLWYAKKRSVALNLKRRLPVIYVLGVEHLVKEDETLAFRLTDVTPRYSNSWSKSQKMRGEECHEWFGRTIQLINSVGWVSSKQNQRVRSNSGRTTSDAFDLDSVHGDDNKDSRSVEDEIDEAEKADLAVAASLEIMPTNKVGFINHAAFALASQLGTHEVLAPDAKSRICGMFKGEVVYRRSDVSTAKTSKKWLYDGRKVWDNEKPIKRVKARKKSNPAGFRKLNSYGVGVSNDGSENFRERQIALGNAPESDENEDLFAFWQTEPWSPAHIGPTDAIPVNEYKNIELALLNPGLVHLDRPRMAQVAKTLGM
jgi:Rad4 beta-hairpin domain 1/Rad4 beta-hairpin domain 2/Rad4 transglutaminase-like domain